MKLKNLAISAIALLAPLPFAANAQTLQTTLEVRSSKPTGTTGTVENVMANTDIRVAYHFTVESLPEGVSNFKMITGTYEFGDEKAVIASYEGSTQHMVVYVYNPEPGEYSLKYSMEYTCTRIGKDGKPAEEKGTLTGTAEQTVKVWPEAKASMKEGTPTAAYNGYVFNLEVDYSGGYDGEWKFEWSRSGAEGAKLLTWLYQTTPITVRVTNAGPVEGTYWYDETIVWPVTIYDQPSIKLSKADSIMLNGDTQILSVTPVGGQKGKWTYSWNINGTVQAATGSSVIYKAINEGEKPQDITVWVTATNNAEGVTNPYSTTQNFEFTVYPTPSVDYSPYEQAIFVGEGCELFATPHGGNPEGWTFQWLVNGTSMAYYDNTKMPIYSSGTNPDELEIVEVEVTATNTLGDRTFYNDTRRFNVAIWPKPVATMNPSSYPQNLISGQEVQMGVNVSGGNSEAWSYLWQNEGNYGSDNEEYQFVASTYKTDGSVNKTVKLTVTNSPANIIKPYTYTYEYDYVVWPRPTANKIEVNENLYSGETFTPALNVHGGVADDWTYTWSLNGKVIATTHEPSLKQTAQNYEEKYRQDIYTVRAVNICEYEAVYDRTFEYIVNVWPQISMPVYIQVSATSIREGNTLTVIPQPAPASGGYEYYWNYDWKRDGASITNAKDDEVLTIDAEMTRDNNKGTIQWTFGLVLRNPGPYGENWAERTYVADPVTIYRRPITPSLLVHKGNGTTHTMITELATSLTDQMLQNLGYIYVFGYTDNAGVDHIVESTTLRYSHFDTNIYNNKSYTFWVYTRWDYPDGSRVTSGKRFLDGSVDNDFDASQYGSGSRSEEAGMDEIYDQNGVTIHDNYFTATVATPQKATVTIFNSAGEAVSKTVYDSDTEFHENINTSGLTAGFYLVEVRVGALREVKKIIVGK